VDPAGHPRDAWSEDVSATNGFHAVGADGRSRARYGGRRRVPGSTLAFGAIAMAAVAVVVFLVGVRDSGSTPPSATMSALPQPTFTTPPTGSQAPHTASSSAVSHGMPPASLGPNWKLTFDSGFTGSQLDTSVWGTCFPWESQAGCANFGNTSEYNWYQPSQDQVSGGILRIAAQKAPTSGYARDGSSKEYSYRSGLVTTFPGYSFQYGYIQVVARLPQAQGLWTALWLAATNEHWPPEIDILEHWDNSGKYYQYYHPADAPREDTFETLGNLSDSWHSYGVYWSQSKVVWFIDGQQVMATSRNVPQQPMYFLANIAVDVPVQSLQTPAATLQVKSVDVWQQTS
jgi:beta-glucanase (GH16 family)